VIRKATRCSSAGDRPMADPRRRKMGANTAKKSPQYIAHVHHYRTDSRKSLPTSSASSRRDERSGTLGERPARHHFARALLRTKNSERHQRPTPHFPCERNFFKAFSRQIYSVRGYSPNRPFPENAEQERRCARGESIRQGLVNNDVDLMSETTTHQSPVRFRTGKN